MEQAKKVFDTMIAALDEREWKYEKLDSGLTIKSTVSGEDFPIEFLIDINENSKTVQFLSFLPSKMPEDKRIDGAIAVCIANYGKINGCFDIDISDGTLIYRLTTSFIGNEIGKEHFEYLIMLGASTVEEYNDKFFMLAKGMMTIEQFIEKEQG